MSIANEKTADFQVAIIGAGFSGLGMGIRLKEAGNDSFVIFEQAEELGGTWRDNDYPGCACDIPSIVYSFSFDQNPDWSRIYPSQPEILAYLKASVARFGIREKIRFGCEVTGLHFDELAGLWRVTTQDGQTVTARVVVSAMGPLNRPNIPNLKGLGTFKGHTFHSTTWDHQYDLGGKKVAVVGTGASAIQFVPQIAPRVAELTIFQRTPPWIMPRGDTAVSEHRQQLFRRFPLLQKLARGWRYWMLELGVLGFLGQEWMQRVATRTALAHMQATIQDPALREALTPNYTFGCKRALVSDDYYPALLRPNVHLVTDPIEQIEAHHLRTANGTHYSADAIIFGTGFVASEIDLEMAIVGCNGRSLFDEWRAAGPEAYYGLSVSGYPNLFFLLGPNTGLGHNSVLLMIESQVNYVMDYLRLLEREKRPFLDLKPDVQLAHNAEIQQKLASTVWQAGGCQSWYQTRTGKNTTIWPGSTFGYRRLTRKVHEAAYDAS